MTKFTKFFALLVACSTITLSFAQENPSIRQSEKSSSFSGFSGFGKDRPKDAKTEITATQEATFDNATNIAEFVGHVVVRDPQFTMTCDRLKVTLSKDRKGIEVAVATGNVIIVQENTDNNGKKSKAIGRAGSATYIPATGNVTLRIWPSVQQGVNNQVATEEGTVMVLNRDGRSQTTGGSKTVISDNGEESSIQ